MRFRRLHPWLLLLALLSTQWLAVAHAIEHPALSAEKSCSICVLDAEIDSGAPLPASPAIAHWFGHEAPQAIVATVVPHAFDARPRARGPPVSPLAV